MNNTSSENNNKNAVIYCRVSTEEQAIKGESLPRQKELCFEFAKKHGYKVVAKFMEEGESGRRADRTQLTKMLAYCTSKKNNISAVICLKSDRFARNIAVARNSEAMLNKSDVDLLFVLETNEKGANAKFIRNFFGLIAENESDVGSERTINGNIGAIQSGRWIKRLKGYSFKTNPYGKRQLYPNDDAIYISKIFELANKGIYKQTEIIEELKKDGFINEIYSAKDKLDKQIKYADKKGIRYVVILGPDEVKKNKITVKDLSNGRQRTGDLNKFNELLRS